MKWLSAHRRQWLPCLALALLSAICLLGIRQLEVPSLRVAERFRGESDLLFTQLSCFLPEGQGKSLTDIREFRQKLESAMVEQSIEAPDGGKLYQDAYSATAQVQVKTDSGSGTVTAWGVGGDFFDFHPLTLCSGSYLRQDDLMDDLILLDHDTAWRLFGGTDLCGLTVYVNNIPFVVGGVVEHDSDFATARAMGETTGIYLSYSALQRLQEDITIQCYELVMPNPISGYALQWLTENFPAEDAVENTRRLSCAGLFSVLKSFGERSQRKTAVRYPYWENALRLREDYGALLLALAMLLAVYPVGAALVWMVILLIRGRRWLIETVPTLIEEKREKRLRENYYRKQNPPQPFDDIE